MICFNTDTDKIIIAEHEPCFCELMIVDTTDDPHRDYILGSFVFLFRTDAQEFADQLQSRGRALKPTNIRNF